MRSLRFSRPLFPLAAAGLLAWVASAHAQLTIDYSFTLSSTIPDNNQQGLAVIRDLGGLSTLSNVTTGLSLQTPNSADPMFLGDVYSSLTYGLASEGPRVAVLLNRVGRDNTNAFGSSLSAFAVNLSDAASTNVFTATSSGGSYQPDGRLISPNNAPAAFSAGSNGLSTLNGSAYASNRFTLLVADVAAGGTARIDNWSLSVTGTAAGSGAVTAGAGGTMAISGTGTNNLGATVDTNSGSLAGGALSVNIISGTTTFSGAVSGANGIVKTGNGTLVLSNGGNSYAGGTTFQQGTTAFSSGALGSAGDLKFTGGTLQYSSGNTQDVSSRVTGSTGAIAIDTNGNNVTFGSAIGSSNSGGLTKTGAGTLTLSGNNTYTGVTKVGGGVLQAAATGGQQALGGTTSVVIDSGGTLSLNTGNQINNAATVNLNGGTLLANGAGVGGQTTTVGALTLSANSIIDLATVNTSLLIGASNAVTWAGGAVLSIYNWNGIAANGAVIGTGTDTIRVGTDATGLNSGQLAQVIFYSDAGVTNVGEATIQSDGTLVPVPEPGTVAAGVLAVLGVAWRLRLRRNRR